MKVRDCSICKWEGNAWYCWGCFMLREITGEKETKDLWEAKETKTLDKLWIKE